ncbi:hypothetical protein SAY86_010308 [Trapa natans]|uniref:Uncharacterized protein n=1 Tax=Trapa natans TaxID=22666 RepID=A0AAN7L3A2_TRANT|nr:hypothetical protein SAY86_010308 [Trapa natans]
MASKEISGEGLSVDLAGMSKNQLYDIMSQMKTLIEQNERQARQILIQNPVLTKALFQAQVMLGMVQPQTISKIPSTSSQQPQPLAQPLQQSSAQAQSNSSSVGFQDQTSLAQPQISARKQPQNPLTVEISSVMHVAPNLQSHVSASHTVQQQLKAQSISMTMPQSSQLPIQLPIHSASRPPLQQPIQTTGVPQTALQAPSQSSLASQTRQSSVSSFHQYPPPMGSNVSYQHPSGTQHATQQMYHTVPKSSPSIGSFPQAQPGLTSQQPPQSLYQVGSSHLGSEFSQVASPMQVDRGSPWIPGLSEPTQPPRAPSLVPGSSHLGTEFSHQVVTPIQVDGGSPWIPGLTESTQPPGPPSLAVPSQAGPGSQPPRTPALSAEMEKALLQQVMSLTPEQINLLPTEQRNQILQLQQMLRQ